MNKQTFIKQVDQAFILVNDRIDDEFNKKILSHENNPKLVTRLGTWPRVQSTYKEYLEKFSKELWEKIKIIIPESPAINDFDWAKELKDYIINHRVHNYYINAIERLKIFEMPGPNEWYDNAYRTIMSDLDYEINAAVGTIKHKFPKDMTAKEPAVNNTFNFNAAGANVQVGNSNTQQIEQSLQALSQHIEKMDISPEKKEKAKGILKDLFGTLVEGVTEGVTKGLTG